MRRRAGVLVLSLLLGTPAWVAGQGMDPGPPPAEPRHPATALYVLGGAGGGTLGMMAGAVVGGGLQGCRDFPDFEDSCQEEGIYLGALLGSTLGSILGVQVMGRISGSPASRRGTVLGAAAGVVGGYLVGLGVAAATSDYEIPFGFGFSVGQGAITGAVAGLFGGG